jgi:hypothetical protein
VNIFINTLFLDGAKNFRMTIFSGGFNGYVITNIGRWLPAIFPAATVLSK